MKNDMKLLMALCYTRPNIVRYECSFDKRDKGNFKLRVFLTETDYLCIEVIEPGTCEVRHFCVSKSFYYPSSRVGYINKYFKKYRDNGSYSVKVPTEVVINVLDGISEPYLNDKAFDNPYPWSTIIRATGRL